MSEPSFPDLRAFLEQLRRDRDLVVVDAEVDPRLEVAEIHRRVIAAGGPALLFTPGPRARTSRWSPTCSARRGASSWPSARARSELIAAAGRAGRDECCRRRRASSGSARDLLPRRPARSALGAGAPRPGDRGRHAPTSGLDRLPALTTWPEDGGPFVTLPLVYTEHPRDRRAATSGMYRMQVHDAANDRHALADRQGRRLPLRASPRRAGEALPVTVFLGGPPALILAAIAPLPENVPELLLASLIAGQRLRARARARAAHPLVADAEFALVGRGPARRRAGPRGRSATTTATTRCATTTRSSRSSSCAAGATRSSRPPSSASRARRTSSSATCLQELLSPLFPLVMPAVRDLWSYGETGYHSLAAAVVQERYRREAMASAFRILGEGQLSLTKFLLRHRPAGRPARLPGHARARARADATRDRPLRLRQPVDGHARLHRPARSTRARKGVWLGLGEPVRELPREFRPPVPPPREVTEVRVFCPGCLVVGGPGAGRGARRRAARIAAHPAFAGWPLVVLTDEPQRAAREPDQLPLDDLHPLRAGGRHPRRGDPAWSATTSSTAADPDRRPAQAGLPGGAVLRRGDRGARRPALAASTSPPATWRWATPRRPTSTADRVADRTTPARAPVSRRPRASSSRSGERLSTTPSSARRTRRSPVRTPRVRPLTFVTAGRPISLSAIDPYERSPPVSTATPATRANGRSHPRSTARATRMVAPGSSSSGGSEPGSSATHARPSTRPLVSPMPWSRRHGREGWEGASSWSSR